MAAAAAASIIGKPQQHQRQQREICSSIERWQRLSSYRDA